MKKNFIKLAILFSILTIQVNCIYAQNAPFGLALSDEVFNELNSMGFESARKRPLSFDNFPYNIEIDFTNNKDDSANKQDFIIASTQEDFFAHKDFFAALLKFAMEGCFQKEGGFDFNIIFIFTASDRRKISGNERTTGTEIFCRSMEGAQNKHALVLDFDARKKDFVTPGSAGEVSPLYLTQPLCNALEENSIDYALSGGIYTSLYNLGILRSDPRLSSFLSRGIPSVMFGILGTKNDFSEELDSIKNFTNQLQLSERARWSRHYIPIKIGKKHFWIYENQLLLLITIFTAICLFILSDFSFLFRKRSRRLVEVKMHALKSNYLIILTAAIISIFLLAGQGIARAFLRMGVPNMIVLFVLKISIPFFAITFLYPLEIKFHKNMPAYIYEYILTISALLNIFIFTMLEISLFIMFAFEYIILALSRTVKRTVFLYIFMLLFLLPFIPLMYSILVYADGRKIFELIFCSFGNNVLLSFAFVPLSLLWLRVLVRLRLKAYSRKKMVAMFFAFSAICLAGIVIISSIAISILNQLFFKNVEFGRIYARIEDSNGSSYAQISVTETEYYGGKMRSIDISSEKDAERYAIVVEGQSATPVYYSIYETSSEKGKAEFLLPDNPPKNITVLYTPDSSEDSTIKIEAYFMEEQNDQQRQRVLCKRETHIFDISGDNIVERH